MLAIANKRNTSAERVSRVSKGFFDATRAKKSFAVVDVFQFLVQCMFCGGT